MRSIYKKIILLYFVIIILLMGANSIKVSAAEYANVDVTIPANLSIIFNEDSTNTISEFIVKNENIVPIIIDSIEVEALNDWQLVRNTTSVFADQKKMILKIGGYTLANGENSLSITVPEEVTETIPVLVERGAWRTDKEKEKAFRLNIGYSLGQKKFTLTLDKNGGILFTTSKTAYNGNTVSLPTPSRSRHTFKGWADENGNLYKNSFVMPIGDITLTAVWEKEAEVFAVYYEEDGSLRFYNRNDKPESGTNYDGRTVTKVYSGFSEKLFTSVNTVPWRSYKSNIVTIEIVDEIKPLYTSWWFSGLEYCTSVDVRKLDTSAVTDMSFMFYFTGANVEYTEFLGLEDMDTSSVTNMTYMFYLSLCVPETLNLDLRNWDVSNVTNMSYMFTLIGGLADNQNINLSGWNTSKVTTMSNMFFRSSMDAKRDNYYLNLSGWDTASLEDASSMFENFGLNTTSVRIEGLENWDVSNLTNGSRMFYESGKNSASWEIGDISVWNTVSLMDATQMFYRAGYLKAEYILDLTKWNVANVTAHENFNYQVTGKVLAPSFL